MVAVGGGCYHRFNISVQASSGAPVIGGAGRSTSHGESSCRVGAYGLVGAKGSAGQAEYRDGIAAHGLVAGCGVGHAHVVGLGGKVWPLPKL